MGQTTLNTGSPDSDVAVDNGGPNAGRTSKQIRAAAPSLRPPTLMIDLLFGALMLFAFQMGDPNAVTVVAKDFPIPTSKENSPGKNHTLLPLKPVRSAGSGWLYELPNGDRVNAAGVARLIKSQKKTAVLLVPSDTLVQFAIDAEQPLQRLGIKAGLAVSVQQGGKK